MLRSPAPPRPVTHNGYPTTDGKPMAETDHHRNQMTELIHALQRWFAADASTYVSGNLILCYERTNKRRHVSPDCFVAFGVPNHERINYLLWDEVPPAVAFEITSNSTMANDTRRKFALYRDVLKVKEYFLFDPFEDYLTPSMQGYRLRAGKYVGIREVAGRLPSQQLGLHLERVGDVLRLWDPTTAVFLPTDGELFRQAAEERERATRLEQENARLRELLAQRTATPNGKNGHAP